ncbi:MAG: hypothetical protein KF799_01030 [Bdellovibrionales bacterium]|nr:hypothetical protein [Bdellovibrionales bacterium]
MKFLGAVVLTVLLVNASGCVQTENSSALDGSRYDDIGGSAAFIAARTIITNNCTASGCHPDMAAATEDDYISANRLVPGNPEGSTIYNYLQGSTGSGPKSMPKNASALSSADILTIRDWVQNAQ